jgi:hypothetical protein
MKRHTHYPSELYDSYIVLSPWSGFHAFDEEWQAIRFMRSEEMAQALSEAADIRERKTA